MFRIYRDVRFSRDKSPYKTHVGIQFRHQRAKDAHAPGYYLHIQAKGSFVGVGMWHPDSASLAGIRRLIQDEPAAWKKAISGKRFRQDWVLEGDSLKRPPKGVDPDHPLIEDLKRKDFIAVHQLTQSELLAADFPRHFAELCREGSPLVRFLCDAVGVEF